MCRRKHCASLRFYIYRIHIYVHYTLIQACLYIIHAFYKRARIQNRKARTINNIRSSGAALFVQLLLLQQNFGLADIIWRVHTILHCSRVRILYMYVCVLDAFACRGSRNMCSGHRALATLEARPGTLQEIASAAVFLTSFTHTHTHMYT